ncbi:MAG: PIN domain-containing protein [Aeromicrobium sp.]|uniref:type II toxin-antitoxin system VapC family toxin n=1 Tax=Aeromicrobium sp. TaxID=1871063 RepID=UPI0039E47CA8
MRPRYRSFLLDSSAVSGIARREKAMTPWLRVFHDHDAALYVSAATLVEVADGTPNDARLRHVLKAMRVVEVDEAIGFEAGRRRAGASSRRRKIRDATIDAMVAATALTLPEPVAIVTSDVSDLSLLLADDGVDVVSVAGRHA